MTVTYQYDVRGLTCGQCVAKLLEQVAHVFPGSTVIVELVRGGASRLQLRTSAPVPATEITRAVRAAGFRVGSGPR